MSYSYHMLVKVFEKSVFKRKNQHTAPEMAFRKVGVFTCDHCHQTFEVEHNLQPKLKRRHHFCSPLCQGNARKANGCLNYVYGLFDPKNNNRAKAKKTMIERYGGCTFASKMLRTKCAQTMVERYGAAYTMKSPMLRAKYDFASSAKKRHETMKQNGLYGKSKPEDRLYELLREQFNNVERQAIVHKWPIDFYVKSIDTYVQFDGVYWHGLDRPIELIAEHKTKRDVVIHKKWLTDREQNQYFKDHNLKLIRIRSIDHLDREILTSILTSIQHQ